MFTISICHGFSLDLDEDGVHVVAYPPARILVIHRKHDGLRARIRMVYDLAMKPIRFACMQFFFLLFATAALAADGVELNVLSDFEAGSRRAMAGDHKMAMVFFEQGAQKGSRECMFALGSQYYFGEGVKKNLTTSRKWFEAAVEKGDGPSAFMLSVMSRRGEGKKADEARANELLKVAANACVPQAQEELASRLNDGDGFPQNKVDAIAWLSLSSEADLEGAEKTRELVKQIKDEMEPADRDEVAKLEVEHRTGLKCPE